MKKVISFLIVFLVMNASLVAGSLSSLEEAVRKSDYSAAQEALGKGKLSKEEKERLSSLAKERQAYRQKAGVTRKGSVEQLADLYDRLQSLRNLTATEAGLIATGAGFLVGAKLLTEGGRLPAVLTGAGLAIIGGVLEYQRCNRQREDAQKIAELIDQEDSAQEQEEVEDEKVEEVTPEDETAIDSL